MVVKYEFCSAARFECEQCGCPMQRRGSRMLAIRDTSHHELDVVLEIDCPVVWCPRCRKYHRVRPQAVHPQRAMTWRFMKLLCILMTECSARMLAEQFRISERSVLRAEKEVLAIIDEARPVSMAGRRAIIIDEKYLGHKRKFVTCVVDGYTGELLWMAEGKGCASLDGFFAMLTEEELEGIKVVSVDRGNAYVKAVREHLPHAELSFDPFHVVKNINDAVTEVRRNQYAKAEKQHKGIIKGMRYALLKAPENLSDRQRLRLETLLEMNAPINTAYVLKEQAREMYKLYYFSDAVPALQEWLELARQSGLEPFQRLAKGMARDSRYILNYFRYKLTSGRIEGVNSMIARVLHKTRGVGSVDYLRLKLRALTSPVFRFLMGRETRLA